MADAQRHDVRLAVLGGHAHDSLVQVVSALPRTIDFSLAIVTNEPQDLAHILRAKTEIPLDLVTADAPLKPGRIYLAPPRMDMIVRRGELVVIPAPVTGVQLDRLMRSAADDLGRNAIGMVLGGVGADGALGIKRIKEAGGLALVESVQAGPLAEMPRAAIATGVVDQVASASELGPRLVELVRDDEQEDEPAGRPAEEVPDTLRDLLTLVRVRSGHDFSAYKRATLSRRVARRMQVCQTGSITAYHDYLRDHPAELPHLLRDFLISVTNFFRDSAAYEALDTQVMPRLFTDRGPQDQIRVWVAGCATGEEAYSIGILLLEHARRYRDPPQIQIFATDIDEDALTEARAGRYPTTIAVDVSPERLEKFFVAEAGSYRVSQELRELVLFSPHNLLRDPPFSKLDLISCRNLMIYLNREAQSRALSVFHFGLKPDGNLLLGASESAEHSAMFSMLDAKARIFARRMVPTSLSAEGLVTAGRWQPSSTPLARPPQLDPSRTFGEMHHRLVERYAPPSILVNGDLEVVHVSEHAGKYLEISGGEPSRHLQRLLLPGLRLDLRAAIYAARQSSTRADARRIAFEHEGKQRTVDLRVRALDMPELGGNAALIYLEETPDDGAVVVQAQADLMLEPVVREIEEELHRTREQLRSTIEQYETSLEELTASNEELQAINEELRSATEELETSKEEMQSVNEELTTLNHELKSKIDEVSEVNSDLQNLMSSTDIGVVFLDRNLHLRRFTARALDLFNLIPADIGRPIAHVTHRLEMSDLPVLAQAVMQTLRTIERDVGSTDGRRYLMRLLPYRSLEDRIDGVVMTFVDVTALRAAQAAQQQSETALETSENRLRSSLRGAPMFILGFSAGEAIWGSVLGDEVSASSPTLHRMLASEDGARLLSTVREVQASRIGRRVELALVADLPRTFDVLVEPSGTEVTAVGFDITPNRLAEKALRDANLRKDEFLATLSFELRDPLAPLKMALEVAQLSHGKPDQLAQSHGIMRRQVGILSGLVDDLLDLSRIAQGKIDLGRALIAPAELVKAAIEASRSLMVEHRHEVHLDLAEPSVRVVGDERRLVQVITNLLTNAAKYTAPGGSITVRLAHDPARRVVRIEVRDTGVGIPAEVLPHVFGIEGHPRDSLGPSRGGLGIGLYLVRRIVELHGGKVRATSAGAGHGSEFVVELPVIPAEVA